MKLNRRRGANVERKRHLLEGTKEKIDFVRLFLSQGQRLQCCQNAAERTGISRWTAEVDCTAAATRGHFCKTRFARVAHKILLFVPKYGNTFAVNVAQCSKELITF